MKTILSFTIIFLFSFSAKMFAQINGCNVDPKIRGPLLIDCNGGITHSDYYLQNGNALSGINWELRPNNSVGTIISQSNPWEVSVEWQPNAASQNAYLLADYNLGGGVAH